MCSKCEDKFTHTQNMSQNFSTTLETKKSILCVNMTHFILGHKFYLLTQLVLIMFFLFLKLWFKFTFCFCGMVEIYHV